MQFYVGNGVSGNITREELDRLYMLSLRMFGEGIHLMVLLSLVLKVVLATRSHMQMHKIVV